MLYGIYRMEFRNFDAKSDLNSQMKHQILFKKVH